MDKNRDGDALNMFSLNATGANDTDTASQWTNSSSYGNSNVNNNACLLYDFIIEAALMGFLCLFGFAGNTLSMLCLWKDKSKTATPFLLISLEIADTLFLVTVAILRVVTSVHQFTGWFTQIMALFPYIGSYLFPCATIAMTSTIYLTILVTVNRYISVCRPYEASNLCSIRQARKQVVVVTILCVLYNIPRFFEFHVVTKIHPETNVSFTRSYPSAFSKHPVYQIIYSSALYFIVMFLVPLITLIILNYKLICALRTAQKRRAKMMTHDRCEDDITLTLIVVVLVFLLTQTPALITQVLLTTLPTSHRICPSSLFYYVRVSDLMVVANSASNFIIYCFCSKRFRQILLTLICKHKVDNADSSAAPKGNKRQYRPLAAQSDAKGNGHIESTCV